MLDRCSEATDAPTPLPPLLAALWGLLRLHRGAFRQERSFRRMRALLFGQLFSFARRTVTQALVALGLTDSDWSAFYRLFNEPRINYEELTGCFLSETLDHIGPHRAQRFLHLAALMPQTDEGYSRALPLRVSQPSLRRRCGWRG